MAYARSNQYHDHQRGGLRADVLVATSNPGKAEEIIRTLAFFGVKAQIWDADWGPTPDVAETGTTLEENARLKVEAFRTLKPGMIVIADDTGVFIDALNGAPGIHTRRWRDGQTAMTDHEIVKYALEKMEGVPTDRRQAVFRTSVAVSFPGESKVRLYEGELSGIVTDRELPIVMPGLPFERIFTVPDSQLSLADYHSIPIQDRPEHLTHREIAIAKSAKDIKTW